MRKIKAISKARVKRLAREHTKYWFFRPRVVRKKMYSLMTLAKAFSTTPTGQRKRIIKALSRDAGS